MNVNEIVRLTLIPIIAAASWSWATARIPLPCFVDLTSQVRMSRTGMVVRMTTSWFHRTVMSPMENAAPDSIRLDAL